MYDQRQPSVNCSMCGEALAEISSLREHWDWHSDGCGGVMAFCVNCARNWKANASERARKLVLRAAAEEIASAEIRVG